MKIITIENFMILILLLLVIDINKLLVQSINIGILF